MRDLGPIIPTVAHDRRKKIRIGLQSQAQQRFTGMAQPLFLLQMAHKHVIAYSLTTRLWSEKRLLDGVTVLSERSTVAVGGKGAGANHRRFSAGTAV